MEARLERGKGKKMNYKEKNQGKKGLLINQILHRTRRKYKKENHHNKPYNLNENSATSSSKYDKTLTVQLPVWGYCMTISTLDVIPEESI